MLVSIIYITVFIFGACWGSFLNMVAWRLLSDAAITYYRSYCPDCKRHIAWYDLIPIISWMILRGTCRNCQSRISALYPFIETLAGFLAIAAYITLPTHDLIWYSIFASTLLITIHTDIRAYAISSLVTAWCLPISIVFSIWHITPIPWEESIAAAVCAYLLFAGINALFAYKKGVTTLGHGDWELIAYIASMIGFNGLIMTMLWGSIITVLLPLHPYYRHNGIRETQLPFGASLALAAIIYPLL